MISIHVKNHKDRNYGYLAATSPHGFLLEDRWWPTVEHYILAKMFSGTVWEEEIRTKPTISGARNMARKRRLLTNESDFVTVGEVYGNDKNIRIGNEWKGLQKRYLMEANRAKFDQHPTLKRRLMTTTSIDLIYDNSDMTSVMRELRREYEEELLVHTSDSVLTTIDVKLGSLTEHDMKLIDSIITLSLWVMRGEIANTIYIGMMEDALYNIIREEVLNAILKEIKVIDISDLHSDRPKYVGFVREIETILKRKMGVEKLPIRSLDVLRMSFLLGGLLRWYKIDSTEEEREMMERKIFTIKIDDLVIPPKRREYRHF